MIGYGCFFWEQKSYRSGQQHHKNKGCQNEQDYFENFHHFSFKTRMV
jgi:hypothetical protein